MVWREEDFYAINLMANLVCSMWNSLEVQYSPIQLKRTKKFPCSLVVSVRLCIYLRSSKLFNPLLGETYEADYPDKGLLIFL
ncbi:putative oxysterol-binding protein superfamily [Helianthus anomalus]